MDGLLALDLWDIVIEVLRSTNNNVQPKHTSIQELVLLFIPKPRPRVKRRQKVQQLSDVDHVPHTHILPKVNLSCTFLRTTKQ